MRTILRAKTIVSFFILFTFLVLSGIPAYGGTNTKSMAGGVAKEIKALQEKMQKLEQRIGVQEDITAIETVMYSYGYYIDRMLYSQIMTLFADSTVSCEIGGRGVYLGLEGCKTLYMKVMAPLTGGDTDRMKYGLFMEHNMIKPVITVAPDRMSAKGRFYYFGFYGHYDSVFPPIPTNIQTGIYENEFVKENGVWKISKLWLPFTTTGYDFSTWANNPQYSTCGPDRNFPPDLATSWYHPFPEIGVVPFSYPNPVTGQPIVDYVDPTRYWIGNWPGEFGSCGHR